MKRIMTSAVMLCSILLSALYAYAGGTWELKKNSNGIKIYTKNAEGSDIKEIKADFEIKGTLPELKKLLSDVNAQKQWVYSTVQSSMVKRINENEFVYYTEKKMPWPVSNRDVVMHVKMTEDPGTGTLTLKASAVKASAVPTKKAVIRMTAGEVIWQVKAVNENTLHVSYWAKADPGGTLPAWVTNMFLTKGPYESFVKFKERMEKG
jgi:hypothetical protein